MRLILSLLFLTSSIIIPVLHAGAQRQEVRSSPNKPSRHSTRGNANQTWQFDKVRKDRIIFKDGKQFRTNLFGLKYIGRLPAKTKAPYLILAGTTCRDCDENLSIYLHSPSDGAMPPEERAPRYPYPGEVFHYETKELIYDSRFFYNGPPSHREADVAWYQRELNDSSRWVTSIYTVKVLGDTLSESTVTDPGEIARLLRILTASYKELKGIEMTSEP